MKELAIWAQSVCRSTMALYREVKRQAGCPVFVIVRQNTNGEIARLVRESQGQGESAYADVVDQYWDGLYQTGRAILDAHGNAVHVFSGYQVSSAVRRLIGDAHVFGLRTVVYDEAPCPMCLGVKAILKRVYYRWLLPSKVRKAVNAADLMLNASGKDGLKELWHLGWAEERIVPFGYVSPAATRFIKKSAQSSSRPLRILHTGVEPPYRDVQTLVRAIGALDRNGIEVELKRTGGNLSPEELGSLYEWADVLVACGLCEPWGMRVNDAIHAGLPVVISSGMGAKWLVGQYGCGCVYEKGNAQELVTILKRFSLDEQYRASLLSGVTKAHEMWTPVEGAKAFLSIVS